MTFEIGLVIGAARWLTDQVVAAIGLPLTLVCLAIVLLVLPRVWPLTP